MLRSVLLGALICVGACEDKVADQTENAAERVTKASSHLRHERRELAVEVADRADDRAAGREVGDDVAGEARDVSREAGELAVAQRDYETLKALRVESLRAAHAVAAMQPQLIEAVAAAKSLAPVMRSRLEQDLEIFRTRLAATQNSIHELAFVHAPEWERRDDELRREMAGMFLARDASWQLLDDKHRDDPFPET